MNLRTDSGFAYSQKNTLSLQKAIKNVLTDYTRQKQINEEHQKINGELREKVKVLESKNNYLESLSDYQHNYLINSIQKQKIKDKIEEIDKRLDFIKIELKKLYIENETIGTETEIDNNEYYIYNLEKEQELRHSQKTILQELLQKSEDK